MSRRFCVFPNDPLYRYVEKGELKPRYWNPGNLFSEVHLISLCDPKKEAKPEAVQTVAGNAKLYIHAIGRPSIKNIYAYRKKIIELIKKINPDAIRAHNPLLMGWYAVSAGKALNIPTVISVHDDYSILRRLRVDGRRYLGRALYHFAFRLLGEERFTLKNVTKIVICYRFLAKYIGHFRKDYELIYNRIFLDQFKANGTPKNQEITILNLGRQFKGKNPENIIKSIKGLPVHLKIIGQGPLHEHLVQVSQTYGVTDQVEFIKGVPHQDLPKYFARSHIFAMNLGQPGVCMPVMEAMASGLPVIINKPRFEDEPEVLGDRGFIVEDTEEGYRKAIQLLVDQPELREAVGQKGKAKIELMHGAIMEAKETELYQTLISK